VLSQILYFETRKIKDTSERPFSASEVLPIVHSYNWADCLSDCGEPAGAIAGSLDSEMEIASTILLYDGILGLVKLKFWFKQSFPNENIGFQARVPYRGETDSFCLAILIEPAKP